MRENSIKRQTDVEIVLTLTICLNHTLTLRDSEIIYVEMTFSVHFDFCFSLPPHADLEHTLFISWYLPVFFSCMSAYPLRLVASASLYEARQTEERTELFKYVFMQKLWSNFSSTPLFPYRGKTGPDIVIVDGSR